VRPKDSYRWPLQLNVLQLKDKLKLQDEKNCKNSSARQSKGLPAVDTLSVLNVVSLCNGQQMCGLSLSSPQQLVVVLLLECMATQLLSAFGSCFR